MTVRPILLLGSSSLHEPSTPVARGEHAALADVVQDLFDTMADFQARHGWGRAIAAPQIGVKRRIVCMRVDAPMVFFNPVLEDQSPKTVQVWEDCMSFPELLVRIENPVEVTLRYEDEAGRPWQARLTEDYAQLLIHEVEHLDGQLATERPVGPHGLALRSTRPPKNLSWRGRFEPQPLPNR